MCTNAPCKKETTWSHTDDASASLSGTSPKIYFKIAAYTCGLCKHNSFAIIYELLNWTENPLSPTLPKGWHHTAVRKIGQVPPQEIKIPTELNERLGAAAGHYKKALLCRAQNYGIAAMAYLRRVIDERTDDLIDIMAELSRTYEVSEEELAALLEAKSEIRYEKKLERASELIPQSLKPSGVNPLGQLYKHTSVGLHGKSDEECISIFDDLQADFEYVFRNLHLQADERREFVKRMQRRAGQQLSV